jgi:lipoprotein-releasing system ATP-binding protein
MTTPLMTVENLTKSFVHEGRTMPVLKGINLTLHEREMLTIMGPSGAGKSTLLHLMGTLDLPTGGRIFYEGRELTGFSSARLAEFRNRSLGFVFQFHHLLPEFSALENVMMPGLIHGQPREDVAKKAMKLLEEVSLLDRVSHRPGELSGGEQQRVALARALVMEPKLVLADEPTGNLDTDTSRAIHELIFRINQERGTTFLVVTHSTELAAKMPRVVRMVDGRIVDDGLPANHQAALAVGLTEA